jgi:hypothetical protein
MVPQVLRHPARAVTARWAHARCCAGALRAAVHSAIAPKAQAWQGVALVVAAAATAGAFRANAGRPVTAAVCALAAGARRGGAELLSPGLCRACSRGGPLRARNGRDLGVGAQRQPRRRLFAARVGRSAP